MGSDKTVMIPAGILRCYSNKYWYNSTLGQYTTTASSVRDDSWDEFPGLMAPSLRQTSQRGLTVIMSCKQEGAQLGVSSHKCGGKSPSIMLSNPATINTAGEERGEGSCTSIFERTNLNFGFSEKTHFRKVKIFSSVAASLIAQGVNSLLGHSGKAF